MLDYFDRVATGYHERSQSFPWSFIRKAECKAIRNLIGDIQNLSVLELGCGAGYYTRYLIQWGASHVTAVDRSSLMLNNLCDDRITGVEANAETLELGETFPVIVSAGLLEFVSSPINVLRRARAHARDGTRFILLVPERSVYGLAYKLFHRSHGIRVQLFDPAGLLVIAEETGWHIEEKTMAGQFSQIIKMRACH